MVAILALEAVECDIITLVSMQRFILHDLVPCCVHNSTVNEGDGVRVLFINDLVVATQGAEELGGRGIHPVRAVLGIAATRSGDDSTGDLQRTEKIERSFSQSRKERYAIE